MTTSTHYPGRIRTGILRATLCLLMAAASLGAAAQAIDAQATVTLPGRTQTRRQAIEAIRTQTGFRVIFDARTFDGQAAVDFGRTQLPLGILLDKLTESTGQEYTLDNNFIIIHKAPDSKRASQVVVTTGRDIVGTVIDPADSTPIEGVRVELLSTPGKVATTFANGRFRIAGIAPGNHVVKLATADGAHIRYHEVRVPTGGDADVSLSLASGMAPVSSAPEEAPKTPGIPMRTTAYYRMATPRDTTVRAMYDEPKSEFTYVPASDIAGGYLPRAAVKTNLLYLATTTLNLAVEIGLAKHWTLDFVGALNPWDLNGRKGGIRHGLLQPEARYWFCNRFERHFVGLHGMYGRYQISDVDLGLPGTDLRGKRYDGWGAGAGISYGYHLPMGRRWGWEFTVGVGYVYLDYKKYNCGECDNLVGHTARHYFGPTRAGASLVFMIK